MVLPLVLGAGGLWLAWSSFGGGESPPDSTSSSAATGSAGALSGGASTGGAASGAPLKGVPAPLVGPAMPASPEAEREAQRELWEKRLARAQHALDAYRESTRYPPNSRPAREQTDTMEPAAPERTRSLSRDRDDVQLRLQQDRVFVAGDEVVTFSVACENAVKEPLPCQVSAGMAHEAEHVAGSGQIAPVPLAFVDDGTEGDARAGDGTYSARFQPSRQGFPLYSGTLRVDFRVQSGSAQGSAFFDIIYTGAPPATFTGQVREVEEQGSLQLYVGLQVRKPGRYVVTGRVDDESGVPFAYLEFNEELEPGQREAKLTVFGKLIRDEAPTFPLKLRDVEGFLLKEMGDPDRELMAARRGYLHTTREYPPSAFSADEWQGEPRSKYLDEFTKDVNEAQQELDKLTKKPSP
ncbi:hypothetical protein P2318_06840 [Myxococcaceae bacterium GXIMD 01537]